MQTYVYDDFTVTFTRAGPDAFHVVARDATDGVVRSEFTMPLSPEGLEQAVVGLGRSRGREVAPAQEVAVQANAEQLGSSLATALLDSTVGPFYDAARDRAAAAGRGIRMTLSLADAPELLSVPWELLYRRPTFLASQRRTPIVRYLETGVLAPPLPIDGAVRVLGVVASPSGLPPLDVEDERRRVEAALTGVIGQGLVTLDWCDPATPRRLREQLRDGSYHILHYIGHSDFTDSGEGLLFLVDDSGGPAQVTEAVLTNLLGDQVSLRLAILNSCEGARTTLNDPFAGIATSLVALGVPAVVAMQFAISDRAAIVFAEELFTSLIGRQYPIDAAVSEARKAVFTEVNEIEWATPVLFLRSVDGQLFNFAAPPAVAAASPSTPAARARQQQPEMATVAGAPARRRRRAFVAAAAATAVALLIALTVVAFVRDWPPFEGSATPTTVPTCAGKTVPAIAWQQSPPDDQQAANLALVQQYLTLVASAQPGGADNSHIYNEITHLFEGTPPVGTNLNGYGNMQAAYARWISSKPDGSSIIGQLVYDNPTGTTPCRTGFICNHAVIEGDQIRTLSSGTLPAGSFARDDYPYLNNHWYAPGDVKADGQTYEDFLVGLCDGAKIP